jgi:hypothetical protein
MINIAMIDIAMIDNESKRFLLLAAAARHSAIPVRNDGHPHRRQVHVLQHPGDVHSSG